MQNFYKNQEEKLACIKKVHKFYSCKQIEEWRSAKKYCFAVDSGTTQVNLKTHNKM